MNKKIKIIGLGGIGSYLAEPLARFLNFSYKDQTIEITLIDGDQYEEKNKERQQFGEYENKAKGTADLLIPKFPNIHFRVKEEYLDDVNVISNIRENDIVFLCVDNHATRKIVSDRCQELDNVTLISGGNDVTDGNVIFYRRKNGKELGRSPTALHPLIAKPQDVNPADLDKSQEGCQEQQEENPQLLFTNLTIAAWMCNVFRSSELGDPKFEQVFVDINSHKVRSSPEEVIVF